MVDRLQHHASITPPKQAVVQGGDPLPGIAARDFARQLGERPSDAMLAEAIALAGNKVGYLMHLVEEDEVFGDELDEWLALEKQLCQEVLLREGTIPGEGSGLMGMIAPFMERGGYVDACGWWVPCDELLEDVQTDLCPKCGTRLEGFIEGSSMGSRCPECGWGVVRTYAPPILEDEREYTIVVIPGCRATQKALRAVSGIAMCNYLAAKRLMQGAPSVLFAGRAVEVLARKNDLERAGVPIEVHPDFPYDKDGKLMEEVGPQLLLLDHADTRDRDSVIRCKPAFIADQVELDGKPMPLGDMPEAAASWSSSSIGPTSHQELLQGQPVALSVSSSFVLSTLVVYPLSVAQ